MQTPKFTWIIMIIYCSCGLKQSRGATRQILNKLLVISKVSRCDLNSVISKRWRSEILWSYLPFSNHYDDKEYAICEIKAWATPTELTSWSCWTSLLDKRKWAHEWKLVTFGGIDWTTIQFRSNKIADLRNMLKLEDLPFCFVILCIYNVLAEKLFKVPSLLQLGCVNGSDLHSVQAL